jgi:hypothetical protein
MQALGRDMAVTAAEQDARQGDPLAGRAQASGAQVGRKIGLGGGGGHG